ncbi:MAG: InlB B-repeat-containing protein, partial [Ruminococcus sp.]|nr:InlB B-repeat-containing protein [Ruminococcus sp.]
TPTRSGYKFTGWYTKKSGGTKVTSSTVLSVVKDRTFYAHWKKKYTLTFNANGGSVSTTTKTYYKGNTLGTLPTPTRSGYKFLGWYTKKSGGTKVTSNTVLSVVKDRTFYAHWESTASYVTLTFNANGGTVSSTSKTYTKGSKVGTLPTAKKSGYTFKGWYTKKSGGTRISYSTVLNDYYNRTFYAQYAVPSFATLRYSFENSLDDYGYTSSYSIPYKAYKYMFDDDYAKYVYSVVGRSSWGGNCFGMSSTSALFNTGKVKQQSFNSKIYFTKQLSLDDSSSTYGMTVREFIECMQVGQYDADIQETFYDNINDISTLVTKVKKCQAGSGSPVIIGLYNNSAGHAVLAYRWKYVSSTKDRIYIYDCNYADSYKYITLYKSGSSYTGFSYEDYTDLTWFTTSNVYEVWSNRDSSTYSSFSSLAVSLSDMKIYNSDGELCAEISNGEFESYRDEIYQAVSFGTTLESALIYLPDDEYTIVNQQDDEQISVTYYSDGEYAQTLSDADEITISQDVSEVEIYDSDGADYEITFYSDGGETTQSGSLDDGTYIIDESGEQAS